ncbi:hypothetical protein BT96DRAFT_821003 [Gymnopus androsaceus JB14]|uniref:Uncharacterized protein n=1 Tax=Gymnopus androsaceus JB14 TaxID=1447944 RepID=A0A6A4HQW0_9AGAR|nr:hypothetical protein BT96DRAFT_821003 [Gymnopus androsaceus JB14]
MGLVVWIAIFVELIVDTFCYVDDTFGWNIEGNLVLYEPYGVFFPRKQAQLLCLWDYLGIPHKRKKQAFRLILTIIGFEIDLNAMTATLPAKSKRSLISAIHNFIATPSRQCSLHKFQVLTGWINWSFNVFPLLRPSLSNVYQKMSGKSQPHANIYLNKAMKDNLTWLAH